MQLVHCLLEPVRDAAGRSALRGGGMVRLDGGTQQNRRCREVDESASTYSRDFHGRYHNVAEGWTWDEFRYGFH